jgi:hypothetical protein
LPRRRERRALGLDGHGIALRVRAFVDFFAASFAPLPAQIKRFRG